MSPQSFIAKWQAGGNHGWADYLPDMPDEEILRRLLALNLERSAAPAPV